MSPLSAWLYVIMLAGMIGLYLLMPKMQGASKTLGSLIGLGALAGALVFVSRQLSQDVDVFFYLFSAVAILGAVLVIVQAKPVYSALSFIVSMLSVAGLLLLLEAEFLAIALVIIYGGAILVTYMFVIMLAQQSEQSLYDRRARAPLSACFVGFLLVATVAGAMCEFYASRTAPGSGGEVASNTLSLGLLLMTRYVVVLELAGILLLLALVGAVSIVRKKFPTSATSEELPVIGESGRKAAPY